MKSTLNGHSECTSCLHYITLQYEERCESSLPQISQFMLRIGHVYLHPEQSCMARACIGAHLHIKGTACNKKVGLLSHNKMLRREPRNPASNCTSLDSSSSSSFLPASASTTPFSSPPTTEHQLQRNAQTITTHGTGPTSRIGTSCPSLVFSPYHESVGCSASSLLQICKFLSHKYQLHLSC